MALSRSVSKREGKRSMPQNSLAALDSPSYVDFMRAMKSVFVALGVSLAFGVNAADKGDCIQLFNGKDLTGWTPKIRYQKFGEDPKKTFRVQNGVIRVGYDKYDEFGETFGHLFYKTPFSHYRIRVEYRFLGEQLKDGPGWAFRNSGLMLHGQDPKTMEAQDSLRGVWGRQAQDLPGRRWGHPGELRELRRVQ